jgi:hypothetical protein
VAISRKRRRCATPFDVATYAVAMGLLIATGPLGSRLLIQANLIAGNSLVLERFLRGAPFLAPMLYADMGSIGLLVLVETAEHPPPPTG